MQQIGETIVRPTLEALAARGAPFTGILYPGLKMTPQGPKVLEFNARFGQPECEAYMRLLKTDVLDLFDAAIDGTERLDRIEYRALARDKLDRRLQPHRRVMTAFRIVGRRVARLPGVRVPKGPFNKSLAE